MNSEGIAPELRLSRASIGRFSLYLRHLEGLLRDDIGKVSSGQLGEALGISDAQVAAGIRGLLNFALVMLRVPPEVRLVSVDLTVQLEQLAFLVQAGADGVRADEPLLSAASR